MAVDRAEGRLQWFLLQFWVQWWASARIIKDHLYLEIHAKGPSIYELWTQALTNKYTSSFGFSLAQVVLIVLHFHFGMDLVLINEARYFPFRNINSFASYFFQVKWSNQSTNSCLYFQVQAYDFYTRIVVFIFGILFSKPLFYCLVKWFTILWEVLFSMAANFHKYLNYFFLTLL